jgi:hypothetical protein
MKSIYPLFILAMILVLSLAACRDPAPTDSPSDSPLLSPLTSPLSTPVVTSSAAVSQITGPNFELDRPILAGATEVSGAGPIELTVMIVDMTMMGKHLGSGTIGPDGRFVISLVEPVIENHVIGIQVVADREFTPEDIEELLTRQGPGFKNYPQVGEALDTVIVGKAE